MPGEPHWFIGDRPTFTGLFYNTVPATDLRLGLCVFGIGSARRPDGPPQSGAAHGFNLIPVSGVGEAGGDGKIGGIAVEGTFNKDMTNDEMPFEAHEQIVKRLSQTCIHIWRAQACAGRKSAHGEVFVCAPLRRVHGSCRCLDAKLPERTKIWEMRKTTNGVRIQVNLTTIETFPL